MLSSEGDEINAAVVMAIHLIVARLVTLLRPLMPRGLTKPQDREVDISNPGHDTSRPTKPFTSKGR